MWEGTLKYPGSRFSFFASFRIVTCQWKMTFLVVRVERGTFSGLVLWLYLPVPKTPFKSRLICLLNKYFRNRQAHKNIIAISIFPVKKWRGLIKKSDYQRQGCHASSRRGCPAWVGISRITSRGRGACVFDEDNGKETHMLAETMRPKMISWRQEVRSVSAKAARMPIQIGLQTVTLQQWQCSVMASAAHCLCRRRPFHNMCRWPFITKCHGDWNDSVRPNKSAKGKMCMGFSLPRITAGIFLFHVPFQAWQELWYTNSLSPPPPQSATPQQQPYSK